MELQSVQQKEGGGAREDELNASLQDIPPTDLPPPPTPTYKAQSDDGEVVIRG